MEDDTLPNNKSIGAYTWQSRVVGQTLGYLSRFAWPRSRQLAQQVSCYAPVREISQFPDNGVTGTWASLFKTVGLTSPSNGHGPPPIRRR